MTKVYGVDADLPQWSYPGTIGGIEFDSGFLGFYPFPLPGAVAAKYLNKCVDGVSGEWHLWLTFFPDRTGVYYERSGGQQFDSATYKVETIAHGREQI